MCVQVAEGQSSVPADWAATRKHSDQAFLSGGLDPEMYVHKLDALPKQDNGYDCGLFMLAYLQFFVYSLPHPDLDLASIVQQAQSSNGRAAADRALEGELLASLALS